MNKVKILSIICIGLVLTNLLFIWFFIINNPHKQGKGGPRKIVIEKLDFDAIQIKEYEKLINKHKTEINKSETKLFELKNKLYSLLITNNSDSQKDSLIKEITEEQSNIERIHYNHFNDIKQLCNPSQLSSFEELSKEVSKIFSSKRPR